MRWFGWLILAVILLAGCSRQGPRLAVAPDRVELQPGEEQPLNARLDGLEGEVVWSAEYGTIIGDGLQVVYRAPDYPVDDVVTVISSDDPRLRAEVQVTVSAGGALTPRIEVTGDLALVFTRKGQSLPLAARVFDAAGRPLPDARVSVVSDDPDSFAVGYDEDGEPLVTALTDKVQSVRLRLRYQGYETWATAVFARLQPGVLRLRTDWLKSAAGAGGAPASVVLKRTPETEKIEPGTVFYSGDARAVWGRVDALELGDDSVTLLTSPARLEDVFAELDYRAQAPPLTVAAVWEDGRVSADAGSGARLARFAACEGLGATPHVAEEAKLKAAVRLRIEDGVLQAGEFTAELEDRLELAAALQTKGGEPSCPLAGWRARGSQVSLLLTRARLDLQSGLEAFVKSGGEGRLRLPETRLNSAARLVLRYQDGSWRPFLDDTWASGSVKGWPDANFAEGGEVQGGLAAHVSLGLRLSSPGEDAELGRLELKNRLPLSLRLPVGGPRQADYPGPSWEYDRAFSASLAPGGVQEQRVEKLLANPKVWTESDLGENTNLDLGAITPEPSLRFSFGSEPQLTGNAEVWLRGGVCDEAEQCFAGELQRLDTAELPGGVVVWRPEKRQRGVYQLYPRLYVGQLGESYPYTAAPRLVVVRSPDMTELPLSLSLRGAPGAPALGVLSYFNSPLWGVTPDGKRVQLTSPLRVWLPADGFTAEPPSLLTPPGRWGYQEVSLACPKRGREAAGKLRLFSNDPEMGEVILPVNLRCDGAAAPRLRLRAGPAQGPAPLRVKFTPQLSGYKVGGACLLDFGDGSPRKELECSEAAAGVAVEHVYKEPGSYRAVFLVTTAGVSYLAEADISVR